MNEKRKRQAAGLLTVAMTTGMTGVPAYAAEHKPPVEESGLCAHHTAHTSDCNGLLADCEFSCELCDEIVQDVADTPETDKGQSDVPTEEPQIELPSEPPQMSDVQEEMQGQAETPEIQPENTDMPEELPRPQDSPAVPESEEEPVLQDTEEQLLSDLERDGVVTVSTTNQFLEAIKKPNTHIRVDGRITLNLDADPSGRMRPIIIPEGTTIEGGALNFRCPMQLSGDVTIRDMELHFSSANALGSVIHREIFLAGHHLTLENVDTFLRGGDNSLGDLGGTESEMLPTVYGGAYPNTGNIGTNAGLTVTGTKSKFEGIYMGHDANATGGSVAYTDAATLSLAPKTVVKKGIYVDKNRSAAVTIKGSSSFLSSGLSGIHGNEHTTLTLDGVLTQGFDLDNVGHLILDGAAELTPAAGTLHNVTVKAGDKADSCGQYHNSRGLYRRRYAGVRPE